MIIQFMTSVLVFPIWLVTVSHNSLPPDLELGKKIYLKHCKVCHGTKGDGKSFAANALNPPPKNFTSPESKKELTQKRMLESASNGRPKTAMMPWKDNLSKEEIRAVVKYIRKELMGVEN